MDTLKWNGFKIHGDTVELDNIVEIAGMISLDINDINNTLSARGENYVTVGFGETISKAFKTAIDNMPFPITNAEKLLIQFYTGIKQPDMSEFSFISKVFETSSNEQQVLWGVSKTDNLGNNMKVVLVSSFPK
nr:hypothetical protein [Muribaculum sp.]